MSALFALILAQAPLAITGAQATADAAQAATAQPMPTGQAMEHAIFENDMRLFYGFFEGCDPEAVAELIHPDFRMVHDLVGLAHGSAEDMLANSRRQCAARGPGGENEGYRNRRLLVPGSRTVRRMGEWGALESGMHTFHEWRGEEAGWVMTGGARYMHVWQWMPEEGRFRLLESLSYDHGAPGPYSPADLERD